MRALWIALAAAVAAVVLSAAAALIVVFPDRVVAYLPGWAQPWVMPNGPQVVLEVEPEGVDMGQAVADSISVIERRLKDLGVRFTVQPQDNNRILLSLSKSADVERVIEVTTRRGRLQFRLIETNMRAHMTPEQAVRGELPAHVEELYGRGDRLPYLVHKRAVLSGRDLVDARAAFDARTKEPVLNFRFNASGARMFGQVTQENVGRPFAIVFDGEVLSAPVIREPILGGTGQISGNFTVQQAADMAILLRAGELPGKLTLIEQR